MRKSLLITFDFPPVKGGVSSFLWQVYKKISNEKIIVLTSKNLPENKENNIVRKNLIFKKKIIWPRWLPLIWTTYKIIKTQKKRGPIHLIQAGQLLPIGTVALIIKRILKIPYIVYIYGQDLVIESKNIRKKWLIKKILKNSESIIACSNFTKRLAQKITKIDQKKIKVIYPCLPSKPPLNSVERIRRASVIKNKYKLDDKKVLISVGNLVKRKGHDAVIKSLPMVTKKISNLRYVIIGNGPERKNLEMLANKLNIKEKIIFTGQINNEELTSFYCACDALILLSRNLYDSSGNIFDVEGFGIVFIEANLYQKPVIGGKSGGVPEAIKDNLSGLLVEPMDIQKISSAIIKLLSNKSLALKLGEQGFQRAIHSFNCQKTLKELLKLL